MLAGVLLFVELALGVVVFVGIAFMIHDVGFLYERTDGFFQALSDLQHRAGSISLIMTAVGRGIALVTLVTMMFAFFCRGGGPRGEGGEGMLTWK